MRQEFSDKTKAQAFLLCGGKCVHCGIKLVKGNHHFDHRVPDALGGLPTVENCDPLCVPCHNIKTAQQDVPGISRAKRLNAKHNGTYRQTKHPIKNQGFAKDRPKVKFANRPFPARKKTNVKPTKDSSTGS